MGHRTHDAHRCRTPRESEGVQILNLHKKKWSDGLCLSHFDTHAANNSSSMDTLTSLTEKYEKVIIEEDTLTAEKLAIANVGRQDAKKHIEMEVSNIMERNIVQALGTMLDAVVF